MDDYLDRHLKNATYIFETMENNAKPLLILLTDAASTLKPRPNSGKMNKSLLNLHSKDTKIITVDLGDEN